MAKKKTHTPLRTYVDSFDKPWFTIHDMGEGLYYVHFAPAGTSILREAAERYHPLDTPDTLEFIGLCELLDSGLCSAINASSRENNEYEMGLASFDPHDEIPF